MFRRFVDAVANRVAEKVADKITREMIETAAVAGAASSISQTILWELTRLEVVPRQSAATVLREIAAGWTRSGGEVEEKTATNLLALAERLHPSSG